MIHIQQKLIDQYRRDLIAGLQQAPMGEQSLYNSHLELLGQLEEHIFRGSTVDKISDLVDSGRRAHGWSFLEGDEGKKATESAHVLFSSIESQISEIKGKA
jgi:hypothetical protein